MHKTEGLVKFLIAYLIHIKNCVMPHGHHSYQTAYDMAMATIFKYPQYRHELPHWKYVLRCCANYPSIYLPSQESYMHHSNTSHTIHFRVYHLIAHCKVHGRWPLDEKKMCRLCLHYPASVTPENFTQ